MFTSVTKKSARKGAIIYTILTVLSLILPPVYESFSYGESSPFMRWLFLVPLTGLVMMGLRLVNQGWLTNTLAVKLFNSSLAIVASGCLVKSIIEISGRSTSFDGPYWLAGTGFLLASLLVGLMGKKQASHSL